MQINHCKKHSIITSILFLAASFGGAVAVPAPALAQVEACPATWYQTEGATAKGYRMCSRYVGFGTQVQIVDLKAGARVVIGSQIAPIAGAPAAQYVKRTAEEWWTYMENDPARQTRGPLQAIVNASFFRTASPAETTELSFGQKKDGVTETIGTDTDTVYTKRVFGLFAGGAKALINDFAYKGRDPAAYANALSNVNSALVSFAPDGGPVASEQARRTYFGGRDTDGDGALDRLYIFTSTETLTAADVIKILRDEFKTSANIQMDGGGSTQLHSRYGATVATECVIPTRGCRKVPNVLAIYAAP